MAFSTVSSSSSFVESHGEIGGAWDGSQFAIASTAPPLVTDQHCHFWLKSGGGSTGDLILQVETQTIDVSEGTCGQMSIEDEEWWWRPTVSASVDEPVIQKYNHSTGNWDDQGWTQTFGDTGPGGYSATQPTGQEASPAAPGTNNSLNWRGTFSLPISSNGTAYRIVWDLQTSVTASSDNATVADWKQGMHIDCGSGTSNADPNDDFTLWP